MGAYSQEEIEAIYRRQFKLVYQICLVLMKNVSDAEDAAQTVFRKVVERGEAFRDPEHEKAWLIVTARNECRDQLKHWWRRCREDASALDALVWEEPEDGSGSELFTAEIVIYANNRIGIFVDVSKIFTERKIDRKSVV